jgi:hypothetical protein
MTRILLTLSICLLLTACTPGTTPNNDDDNVNPGGDNGGIDNGNSDETGGTSIVGRLAPGQASKRRPRLQSGDFPYTIVAQSDQTGDLIRVQTDSDGNFEVPIPESEQGNTFTVTIVGPDGHALGPVLLGASGNEGYTGLATERTADLGTLELPDDPATTPITIGADGDAAELVDSGVFAELGQDGAPVGLASFGKGQDVGTPATGGHQVDADKDGLIDAFDADDDGNGVVDDFEGGGSAGSGLPPDTHVNFFMNLKINAELANTYYSGTSDQIANRLKTDTVITLEALMQGGASRQITGVHLLETPGPSYLPLASVAFGQTLWQNIEYAFTQKPDRWDVFVTPNAVMEAGDSFAAEIAYDDGTTAQYTRMLNYIFKNIPKLTKYGPPGSLAAFDINDAVVNGAPSHPIPVDAAQDLKLEFEPPRDENGDPITGMDYSLQFFFYDAFGGGQDVDLAATWGTLPAGMDVNHPTIWVTAESLGGLSGDGTYSVTIPGGAFPASVVTKTGGTVAIDKVKIDVTAECASGNAAIMLTFKRQ